MNGWDFANVWLTKLVDVLSDKWTRLLSAISGTLNIVAAANVIPPKWAVWLNLLIAILTYWRGSQTANTYKAARAIVSATTGNPNTPVLGVVVPAPSDTVIPQLKEPQK